MKSIYTSKVSSQGQVTIPKEVRDSLQLEPGDQVLYEIEDGTAILRRLEPLDAAFHAALSVTMEEWASAEDEAAYGDL